ncbi:MAG TPA: response regulator [Nitrososphaeraceae archaeon]|nr:response regulator [Nitrososphaeraceae archaeon]
MVDGYSIDENIKSVASIGKTKEILLIDDDPDVLNLFSDFLKREGFRTASYLDPLVALREIRGSPKKYSLVITDIRMPGISGLEIIKKVCQINQGIKVILISAFELDGDNLKGIKYEDFIKKPVHLRSLAETIDKILKS